MQTEARERLRALQLPDGALPLGGGKKLVPYFSCLAALGLVAAGETEAARLYLRWHDAHREPDGTLFDGELTDTGWRKLTTRDSTDSYAAVYLELAAALKETRFVAPTLAVLRRERQSNGLTVAKPDYPVCYTMDNVEVWRGFRAVEAGADAARTLAAIDKELWDERAQCYRLAVQPDGGIHQADLMQWYPGQMAQLMAIGWLLPSERRRTLYQKLPRQLPEKATTEDQLDRLVWWGYAAQAMGDSATLKQIQRRLTPLPPALYNTALYGHVLRLLAKKA